MDAMDISLNVFNTFHEAMELASNDNEEIDAPQRAEANRGQPGSLNKAARLAESESGKLQRAEANRGQPGATGSLNKAAQLAESESAMSVDIESPPPSHDYNDWDGHQMP
jgi:hypothetical protein